MADWTVPSTKGYVPKGRFLRGISRGIEQFGEGAQAWSAQMLAIKQWEAEKEEKRRARQREQVEFIRQELAKSQQQERDRIYQDILLQNQRKYDEEQGEIKHRRAIELENLRQKGRVSLAQTRIKPTPTELDKVESDKAITTASSIRDAIDKGDVGRLRVLRNNVRYNGEKGRFLQQKPVQVRDAQGNLTTTNKVVGANDYRILLKAIDEAIGGGGTTYEDLKVRLQKITQMPEKQGNEEIRKMIEEEGISEMLIDNLIFEIERE